MITVMINGGLVSQFMSTGFKNPKGFRVKHGIPPGSLLYSAETNENGDLVLAFFDGCTETNRISLIIEASDEYTD